MLPWKWSLSDFSKRCLSFQERRRFGISGGGARVLYLSLLYHITGINQAPGLNLCRISRIIGSMDERQDGGLEPPMEYIALARASELSGVSPATLSRQARMGKLRAVMKGHTLLTTRAEVTIKGGRMGRLLEPLFAMQARRLSKRSLAAFKYLVEHGTAPPVSHSRLPAPLASC